MPDFIQYAVSIICLPYLDQVVPDSLWEVCGMNVRYIFVGIPSHFIVPFLLCKVIKYFHIDLEVGIINAAPKCQGTNNTMIACLYGAQYLNRFVTRRVHLPVAREALRYNTTFPENAATLGDGCQMMERSCW